MRTDVPGPDPGAGSGTGTGAGTGPQPDAGPERDAGGEPGAGAGRPATRAGEPRSGPGARPAQHARAGRAAVSVVFAVHGTASGTFATRIPWLREHLGLSPGWLGLALVFMTAGASAAMPLAARAAHRHGPRRALAAVSLACCAGLVLPPLAPALGWLCPALFLYGCGLGLMDVAMNAQGVRVEAEYGRSVMSSLHGLWSVGTLVGGAGGVLAAHAGLDARVHLGLAAPLLAAAAVVAARWTPDREPPGQPESAREGAREDEAPPRFALPPRGVVAIGLLGFCAVFAEGASMDWSGIYLADVTGAGPGLAASAYTAFACTMALARLSGDAVVRRFGPVATVRAGGALAAAGGALVVAAHTPPAAVIGFALIGVGIAVVVPLCFAAAGRTAGGSPGRPSRGWPPWPMRPAWRRPPPSAGSPSRPPCRPPSAW